MVLKKCKIAREGVKIARERLLRSFYILTFSWGYLVFLAMVGDKIRAELRAFATNT